MRSRRNIGSSALHVLEHFEQIELVGERAIAAPAPIVEVAGDDQRRLLRHRVLDPLDQRADLPLPAALGKAEMHVDAMQDRRARRKLDLAVKKSSAFEHVRRNILVFLSDDRKPRQHRIAVMAVAVHGVLSVRDLAPHRVGDELVLRLAGPLVVAIRVPLVDAEHFLQEKDVGRQTVQPLLHLVDDHPPSEVGEALVDVVGRDGEAHR